MRCFRMNSSGDEPSALLSESEQWTAPWGGSDDGARCDKCDATGTTQYECWSCVLTGADQNCPVCAGRVRWEGECPVCRGSGTIDGKPRHGISVFPTVEGLYRYMISTEADMDDCVVVELEAREADDVDFDADQGAMLVIPTAVVGCSRLDQPLAEEIRRRIDGARPQA